DWNDYLVPNAGLGSTVGWCKGGEDWGLNPGNTNVELYTSGVLGPYVGNVTVYKCPQDNIPSDNGNRLRSISMNSCLLGDLERSDPGEYRILKGYTDPWRVYAKANEITCPTPSDTWVFADETMYSLNDGYLQMNLKNPDYPDVPAKYDCGGNCLSF